MTSTPTLDTQRTDQLRSFLTVEAAADAARRPPVLTPARRRVVVGAAAALLLAGGLVGAQSVGGSAPAAIAVEVDGEWTTIRLVDIDADPDAVVADLIAAGFDAERQTLEVITVDGDDVLVGTEDDAAVGARGFVTIGAGEGGERGLVGLSVTLPEDVAPSSAPAEAGRIIETDPVPFQAGAGGLSVVDEDLLDAGVRFEDDGGVSIRTGTDATIVVSTES
ncbi:MAG TPA: hypothetical protein VGO60_14100 [Iamia sp.]|jgi:hypothetical protein|nr:hypothetical protein [Iamia sp.]